MRIVLNILTLVFAAFALLIIGNLYVGLLQGAFSNGAGMAIIAFQLFGAIASGGAVILGLIGWYTGDRTTNPPRRIPKLGVAIGGLGLLALILPMIFF